MNIYKPELVEIKDIIDETPDIKTFKLQFKDPQLNKNFHFKPASLLGILFLARANVRFVLHHREEYPDFLECSFKLYGKVTNAMRKLKVGDTLGLRGPYGNYFPVEEMKGKNIVFIAGGIGLAPVRCVIWNVLDLRSEFKDITIIYGANNRS